MKTNQNKSKIRVHPASIRLLTDATWDFAHSILWDGYPFSKVEIALAKIYIQQYYEEIPAEEFTETAHKYFTVYCETILMANEYVSRFSHLYIPHPCIWLDKWNTKGFAGTKSWYFRNLEKRQRKISICENCQEKFSINPISNHFYFTE